MKTSRIKSLFTGRHRARYRRRLKVEQLERRKLLASDISLSGGNLLIEDVGTAVDDSLTLRTDTNNFIFNDPVNTLSTSIPSASGDGTNTVTVPRSAVSGTQIQVQLQGGDDQLIIASDFDPGSSFVVLADMGSGNDLIYWNSAALLNTINVSAESIQFADSPQTTGVQSWTGPVSLQNSVTLSADFFSLGDVALDSHTLTLAVDINGNISGSISGTGGIVKQGPGNATLSGTSNYSGSTLVTAGSLRVTGQIESATTVGSGGSLSGTGNIFEDVTVAGTLSPGVSAGGILNTHNLDLQSGSDFAVELGGSIAGTDYDQVAVTGSVTLAGELNLDLIDGFAANQQFVVIDNDGTDAVAGTFTGLAEGATVTVGAAEFQISYAGGDGNDVVLTALHGVRQVTNANDSGPGSLRQAIFDANAAAGLDVVTFNIAGTGPHTIQPLSGLPVITDPIIVDGASAPDYAGSPVVELDGTSAGAGADGLVLGTGSDGSVIRSLVINRFGGGGVEINSSDNNVIRGNFIGVDITGTTSLGNAAAGIQISSANNTIGGSAPAARNIISGNGGSGIDLVGGGATGNTITGNSIYANAGLGIDLGGDGVTPNDAGDVDTGPNNLQNYPVLAAAFSGPATNVIGSFDSLPSGNYSIDFYASTARDPSGHGEGERSLGSTTVSTDAAGYASFSTMVGGTNVGEWLTATATDAAGNTSEFSAAVASVAGPDAAGDSLQFDGVDDFVEIPDDPSLHSDRQLTVETWFKIDELSHTPWQNLIHKGNYPDCGEPSCSGREYAVYVNTNGYLYFTSTSADDVGDAQTILKTDSGLVKSDRWHHFAGVINSDTGSMEIYLDGELVASREYSNAGIRETIGPLRFVYDGHQTKGQLDEMRLWNVARTQQQIQADMFGTLDGTETGLAGYWQFDEGSGDTVIDLSGNGNDGSFVSPGYRLGVPGTFAGETAFHSYRIPGGGSVDIDIPQIDTTAGSYNTVSFWMFWNGAGSGMPFGFDRYDLWMNGSNFGFNAAQNTLYGIKSDGLAMRWTHVTAAFHNGDIRQSKLWIDGVPQVLQDLQNTAPVDGTATSTARISGWTTQNGYRFNGYLNEVAVFNRQLSDAEVQAQVSAATATTYRAAVNGQTPVAYYQLDETTGTLAADSTGNGNDGIYSGDLRTGEPEWGTSSAPLFTSSLNDPETVVLQVTNTQDAGPGSLRQAMLDAHAVPHPYPVDIVFAIPATDPNGFEVGDGDADVDAFSISLATALPTITRGNVTIDGRTQGDTNPFGPEIVLNGSAVSGDALQIYSSSNQIHALNIHSFGGVGIGLYAGGDNRVAGNYIGVNVDGTTGAGNYLGVRIANGSSNNTIGGFTTADRNIVSGNTSHGIEVSGSATSDNVVIGNYIGTDRTGNIGLGNGSVGIRIYRAHGTVIGTNGDLNGDAEEGNLISGNNAHGIQIDGDRELIDSLADADLIVDGTYPSTISTATVSELDFRDVPGPWGNWGFNNPIPGGGGDDYVVLATGSFEVPADGNYSFSLGGDDGGRLRIDGSDVVVDDSLHGFLEVYGSTFLTAGTHTFEWLGMERWFGAGWEVAVKAGVHTSGPANAANGWGVLGDPAAGLALTPGTDIDVTVYYSAVDNSDPTIIAGNLIGTNADGSEALGNANGILIQNGAQHTRIGTNGDGDSDVHERNVISGNAGNGIWIRGADTDHTVIAGNYIGTNINGTSAIGNGVRGVLIQASPGHTVIGTNGDETEDAAERNIISGNAQQGIRLQDVGTHDTVIAGNYIGTNASGNGEIGNHVGIQVANFPTDTLIGTDGDGLGDEAERNVISGNIRAGIYLATATRTTIAGNYVGTNALGTQAVPNGRGTGFGIHIGGTSEFNVVGTNGDGFGDDVEANLISGNSVWSAVFLAGAGVKNNVVAGNLIGTNASGTAALANNANGIEIKDAASSNRIGTNADGRSDDLERNIISGNTSNGIFIWSQLAGPPQFNHVAGNYIGTNKDGTGAIGNGQNGVLLATGASNNIIGTDGDGFGDSLEGNVISGNDWDGIRITDAGTDSNIVAGNFVGTARDGSSALPNNRNGIFIRDGASKNLIGEFARGQIVVEAEHFTARTAAGGRQWRNVPNEDPGLVPRANARGGEYLQVLPDVGGNNFQPLFENGPVVSYTVQIDVAGEYQLYPRWDGHDGNSDSLHARIAELGDGPGGEVADWYMWSTGAAYNDADFATGNWDGLARFESLNFSPPLEPAVWTIETPGTYTIEFTHREDGVSLDAFILQRSHLPAPTGDGPPESTTDINGSYLPLPPGTSSRNVISGNAENGVLISGTGTSANIVAGNFIGVNSAGTGAIGNQNNGVLIENGASGNLLGTDGDGVDDAAERNVISGNGDLWSEANINIIGGHENVVAGNYIGINAEGDAALTNIGRGVRISDGSSGNVIGTDGSDDSFNASERNIISGHSSAAVFIAGNSNNNVVAGNYVGLDASGTIAIGNAAEGISISGSTGNRIGTNADAIADALERNVVVASDTFGIQLADPGTELNTVAGNFIGVGVDGTTAFGNAFAGIGIANGAIANTIGGSSTAERNLISGNAGPGVYILRTFGGTTFAPSPDNIVRGNFIGTDLSGAVAVANQNTGIWIEESGTVVDANVISGNQSFGVLLAGDNAAVSGNYIGTNAAGTAAIPNSDDGVRVENGSNNIIGGPQTASRNVISGNANDGIAIHGAIDTVVVGNYVGLTANGVDPLGNDQAGILVTSAAVGTRIGTDGDGIDDAAEGNVISDNSSTGIRVSGTGTDHTVVAGNYVGVDFSGAAAVGNRQASGIVIQDGARFTRIGTDDDDPRESNVVVGAGQGSDVSVAIWVISGDASDNMIAGNHVGLNASGANSIGFANAGIAVSSANNLIDDNRVGSHLQFGIGVYGSAATGNALRRNYVGTDATGTLAQGGNPLGGVFVFDGGIASPAVPGTPTATVIGGDRLADGNLISGNSGPGIALSGGGITDTEILGNFIGTSRNAAQDLGNAGAGVHISAGVTGTQVGSIVPGFGNIIAFNSSGVVVEGSGATIRGNAVFSNDGLGIDLADDGVTSNDPGDADDGPNGLQNYPELTSATAGAFTNIKGQLESTPNATFDVDFYKSPDPAGNPAAAQGRRYLGSVSATTDASGLAAIDATFSAGSVDGEIITAVATDAVGNSSEFSEAVAAIAYLPVTIEPDQLILTEILEEDGYGDPASTFTEGSRVRLDGLFANSDGTASHTIEINWGDGSELAILAVAPGIRGFAAEHLYDDDRPSGTAADDYVISVFVIDSKGASGAASTVVTIENQAPAFAEIGLSPASGNEGDTLLLEGSFEDPGNDTHQLIIDWGDGSATQTVALLSGERSFSIPHRFLDNASNISVRLLDDDTGETTADLAVAIGNLPPVPAISGPAVGVEGSQINLLASATDPGVRDVVELSWDISVSGRHVASGTGPAISFLPEDQGTFTVSLTARDNDDAAATITHEIVVANAPPKINAASIELLDAAGDAISEALEGHPVRLLGSFIDPGSNDRHVVEINWGDGSPIESMSLIKGVVSFDAAHVYLDDSPSGGHEVTITVSDLDGGTDVVQRNITVGNVAPTVMLIDNGSDADTVRLRAKVDDPSPLDTFTYQWLVDGEPIATGPGDATIQFDRPATASGTVTVTVTDDDGGVGSVTAVFAAGTEGADEITVAPTTDGKLSVTVSTDGMGEAQIFDRVEQIVVVAGGGDDKITIDPSLDIDTYIDGGPGDDEIITGNGNNTIDISEGDDTLTSGTGNDTIIVSGFSNKTITDHGGIDTFDFSGVQPSAIDGEGVTLNLRIDDGTPQAVRSEGTISLRGTFENIIGTDFRDKFIGNLVSNRIFGGGGDDTIIGGGSGDSIDGGDGNDLIFGGSYSGSGDDTIDSGSGYDSIGGAGGNDLIFGGAGDDSIYSGGGNDSIDGGDGNDLIFGGGGEDTIWSGSGDSTIDGGSGNDLIFGTALGHANLYGGTGDDTVVAGGGEDSIDGGDGNDLIFGGGNASHIFGGSGDDTINGGAGDATIDGGDGNDLIFGGRSLGVALYGGGGDDTIMAGGGEETIDGGDGNDLIFGGGGGRAEVFGGMGDDTIYAGDGDDSIHGGDGNDLIFGGSALNVNLYGGSGDDTIVSGGGGAESIDGGDGNDLIFGGGGSTQIFGGLGDDTIYAGNGDDSIDGGEGNDLIFGRGVLNVNLYGGDGDDTIVSGGGAETIDGGDGNDLIFGGGGSTQLFGGLGDDTIYAGNGDDSIDGGEGNDLIFGRGVPHVNLYGGSGDDTIVSGGGADTIDGGEGNDLIFGGRGNARLYGGSGDDTIHGGSGSETIDGGSGNDLIFGGGGDDTIMAGEGSATIDGGSGNDLIFGSTGGDASSRRDSILGGDGDDIIFGGSGGQSTIDGGAGNDSIIGGTGNDLIFGGAGDDTITAGEGDQTIDGGAGNDLIFANQTRSTLDGDHLGDSISGGDGDDLIYGGSGGGDTLDGGAGNDTIIGGDGNDLIFGGYGDDSISGSTSGSDTIDGGSGNDLIFAEVDGDAVLIGDRLTLGSAVVHFVHFEAAALYGGDEDNLLDASAATIPVKLVGGGGNDTLLGGSKNDILHASSGDDFLSGGDGDDIYTFDNASTGMKTIVEDLSGGEDTVSFRLMTRGITLDMSDSDTQWVTDGLALTLQGSFENAFGTSASDILTGNSLNNKLIGYGGHDYLSGGDGDDILQAGATRHVFLDFDSASEPGDFDYTPAIRDAIQARMEQDYAAFDILFHQSRPAAGPYVTVLFNASVTSQAGSGMILGGISDRIGWRELAGSGTVQVDVNGFFQSASNRLPATEENYIALSSTIASHELGHSYGLRHHDAFGPPGNGIFAGLNAARFRPVYTGPAAADETRLHLSASPASIGTTLIDALGNPFFGEREALKLAFAESGSVTQEWDTVDKTVRSFADGTNWLVQSLGELAPLAVPNTVEKGVNAGVTLMAAAEAITGSIELVNGTSESDFYSFIGQAGDVVTIEVMSQVLRHRISNSIDSVLRVYDGAGEILDYYSSQIASGGSGAFNDDSFEPTDSLLLDLILPEDGTYTIEVATFSFMIPEISEYLGGLDFTAFCTANPLNSVCANTDTGDYELLIYRFDDSQHLGEVTGDTLVGGAGADVLIGNSGHQTFLGFNPDEDVILDKSLIFGQSASPTIVNAAPRLLPADELAGVEGAPVSFQAFAHDDDGDTLTWQLDQIERLWGSSYPDSVSFEDATIDSESGLFSFTPADDGLYRVRITVTDLPGDGSPGQSDSQDYFISVANVDPTGYIESVSSPQVEGTEITILSEATDPAGDHDVLTYFYQVTKNGEAFASGEGIDRKSFSFTPDDDGWYKVTLGIQDEDGGVSEPVHTEFDVLNADPIPKIEEISSPRIEGSEIFLTASATDPGVHDKLTFSYEVLKNGAEFAVGGNQTTFSFVPDDNGSYTIVLTVKDEDGGSASTSTTIEVDNVAPVVATSSVTPAQIDEGQSVVVSGTVTDAGTLDTHTVSIQWGDGMNSTAVPVDASGHFSVSHVYLNNPHGAASGDYTITVTAEDNDGGISASNTSLTVSVRNVAPVIQQFTIDDSSANATGRIDFTAVFTDAGVSDTHTATVDWGDGIVESAQSSGDSGFGTVTGTHVYDIGGDYLITLSVRDDAGATTHRSVAVHVNRTGVYLVNGQLRIFGTPNADTIFVMQVRDSIRVRANFLPGNRWQNFPAAQINNILIHSLEGNDYVHLVPTVFTASTIDAGPGNDIVLGGSGPDLIDGGDGDDHLSGRWGDDTIYGGAGNDKLWGSFGDDILDGGDGDDRLWGGHGNDILIGGPGNDRLHGGTGRDLLIGGAGADRLKGGTNDDILIGGTTAFDNRQDALAAVMAEWTSDRRYDERVSNLRDGTGTSLRANGSTFLQADITVFDDGAEDWMQGGSGRDWFFALDEDDNEDNLKDDRWHEQVDLLFAEDEV